MHDSEEGLQSHPLALALTVVHLFGVHLPTVLDHDGMGEGGEVHFAGSNALEDALDGPTVDPVGHILLGQLPLHLGLIHVAVVHGDSERREGALQVGDHGEGHEGDVPLVLHVGKSHSEGDVSLCLREIAALHHNGETTLQACSVHSLASAHLPRDRCSPEPQLLREVQLSVQVSIASQNYVGSGVCFFLLRTLMLSQTFEGLV